MELKELKREISEVKESLQWILTDLQQNKGSAYEGERQLVDNTISKLETMESEDNWNAETSNIDFYWGDYKEDLKSNLQKIVQIDSKYYENYENEFMVFAGRLDAVINYEYYD